MGAGHSATRKVLLTETLTPAQWQEIYVAEWRSERSKELDRHGGPSRPPVARGDSFTAKLNFLEAGLRNEQRNLKIVLDIQDDDNKGRKEASMHGKATPQEPRIHMEPMTLHTDFRAVERRMSESSMCAMSVATMDSLAVGVAKDFSLLQKDDPELRRKMAEQRKKMMEYAKTINVAKGAPQPKSLNLPEIKSKVAANWKSADKPAEVPSGSDDEGGEGGSGRAGGQKRQGGRLPADWRIRMHRARRRTMMVVAAAAKWQLALAQRPGPKRLPRVSSFSYYIPKVLGDEAPRFIEEAKAVAKIYADAAGKLEEQTSLEQEQLATVPTSATSPMPRAPPRRGLSDSGASQSAVAAAAAAGAAAGSLSSMGGTVPSLALGKTRPQLLKSSSGKSNTSLPDLGMGGHNSDADVPYGRSRSRGRDSTPQLPAIGSRASLTELPSVGSAAPPDGLLVPTAPRLPRSMLPGGEGSPRMGRRQSDSAVAAALPAGIAAAAAAGAATLSGGLNSGGSGSGAAALVDRRGVRAAPRPRGSDNGAGGSRLKQRDGGSEGGANSPFMANLQHANSSGSGFPPKRRSDAGTQLTAGALASVGSAPADGGFLPPISANGGGGDKAGASKPTTLAQARRMALLSEAGNSSGGSDDSGFSRGNMSPSRLGPLKLGNNGGTSTPTNGNNRTAHSRSPEKSVAGSPSVAGQVGSSILDTVRQSREGGLLAGGNREFREALAVATSMATAGGGGPQSPINSPGYRNRMPYTPDTGSLERQVSASSTVGSPKTAGNSFSGGPRPLPPVVTVSSSDPGPSSTSPTASPPAPPPVSLPVPAPPVPVPVPVPVPPPGPPPANPPPARPVYAAAAAPAAAKPAPPPPLHRSGSARAGSLPPPPPGLDPEASARLSKAQQLMGMYANRVNAQWAEAQQWAPPTVLTTTEQELFCGSDAWVPYKVTVLRHLKAGSLAVHIDACQDAVVMPDGSSMDVWTSCPWALVQTLRPGSLPLSERIEGVPHGARVLQQLLLAVEALAGKEAVGRLVVVLAINDDQRNAVVADILRSRSYGLKPENLILTAQRKRCGYRYDREAQAFLEDPGTAPVCLGSGYSLCQLAWLGDAFYVGKDGELTMLMGKTLLERFSGGDGQAKVEWLVCRRARDLSLLTPEGILDLQQLAYGLFAADRHNANMVTQAAPASSVTIPRAYDSTLLSLKNPGAASPVPNVLGGSGSGSPTPQRNPRLASVAAAGAGVEGGGGGAGVIDLRAAELSSPVMVEALAAVRKRTGNDGWVGLQRYLMHVPTLHDMLNTLGIFRPKLAMSGDVARLSLDAADITADPRSSCVAVQNRTSPAIITSPNEVDDLIPLLLAQDHSAEFRDMLAHNINPGGGEGAQIVSSPALLMAAVNKPGQRILVYIAANDVTQLAVNLALIMARPGRDVVHLVTVVHNNLQLTAGQQLVLKYLKQLSNAMIETHVEVLVKGINGLLEVMEGAASKLAPNLVVMASAALTMSNLNTATVMGSVTLSVLKRLSLPVAVVTSNSKHLMLTQRRTALRCMAVVESTSRPALHFLCTNCMEPMRGDKLVLAAHHPTRQMTTQQQQTQRRLVDNFSEIASSHRFHSAYRMQLDGPMDKAIAAAVEEEPVHLVGLQVAVGTKGVPGHVLGLIRSCKGGVLVFRDTMSSSS